MRIARGLIALRERCGLTQTQVAERAGVSKATVSRYEAWQDRARIRWATVKALADACEASAEEREALVRVVKSQSEGWWVGNSAVPEWIDPLVSFEHEAEYEHVYANNVVPGLLQTRGYATAIHRATELRTPNEQVERMVDARTQRQSILDRQVSSSAGTMRETRSTPWPSCTSRCVAEACISTTWTRSLPINCRSITFVHRQSTRQLHCGCWGPCDRSSLHERSHIHR